jgi:hypothetical protein
MGQQDNGSFGSEPPAEWSPRSAYAVRLTVNDGPSGDPAFSYVDPLFDSGSALDLAVIEDCLIVLECDRSNGLSWSLATDAITLKDGANARFYFALKYVDRGIPYDRDGFPAGRRCTQICFGARLNVEQPENRRHAFNLDVELERSGGILPIRIDPDIQNPKA